MANEDIKNLIRKHRLHYYEIADAMGISPGYLSTLLRKPFAEDIEKKAVDAVNNIISKEK